MRRFAVSMLTASLVLGACASGGETSDPGAADPTATSSLAPAVGEDGPSAAPSASASATPQERATATAAPSEAPDGGSASAPTSEPAPSSTSQEPPADGGGNVPTPVPAGTYEYDTQGQGQVGTSEPRRMPAVTTLAAAAPRDDRQVLTRDLRDDEGYGSVSRTTVQYGVEGALLLGIDTDTTVEVLGSPFTNTTSLTARPPAVIVPVDAEPGYSTEVHLEGDDTAADGTVTITGREQVDVGGTMVEALVLDLDFTFSGEVEGYQRATWWVRPSDVLVLREQSDTEATSQGVTYTEQRTSRLRSLQPR